MEVSLKTITPDIETTIVEIARVSSKRKDKKENPAGLINYLIRNKHWSPFEHGFLTFEIVTSKAIAIQMLRHRSNYFQELSQRYQDIGVAMPEGIFEEMEIRLQASNNRQSSTDVIGRIMNVEGNLIAGIDSNANEEQKDAIILMHDSLKLAEKAYNSALEAGIARECARFVLPMATKTRLYISMNVRSVIHWLDIRDDSHAQKEFQLIAKQVKNIFIDVCPIISEAREYKKV